MEWGEEKKEEAGRGGEGWESPDDRREGRGSS